jgi:hypothetical protein
MSLIALLGKHYPGVKAHCIGDDGIYSNITWDGGDPLPPEQELLDLILLETKSKKINEHSNYCAQLILSGFTSNALGSPHGYDSEDVDQINILGALAASGPRPSHPDGVSLPYAARPIVDGVYMPKIYIAHTHEQLKQVVVDGAAYKLGCLQHFNELRDDVNAAATLQEVEAVVW